MVPATQALLPRFPGFSLGLMFARYITWSGFPSVSDKAQDASGHSKRALHREVELWICCVLRHLLQPLWLCSPCAQALEHDQRTPGQAVPKSSSNLPGAERGTEQDGKGHTGLRSPLCPMGFRSKPLVHRTGRHVCPPPHCEILEV